MTPALFRPAVRSAWRTLKALARKIRPQRLRHQRWVADFMNLRGNQKVHHVIDVGANRGQTSSEFLALFPDAVVYAVEPVPRLAQQIEKVLGQNERLIVLNCALGSEEGEKLFRFYDYDEASSFLDVIPDTLPEVNGLHNPQTEMVAVSTLDQIFRRQKLKSLGLLKLDAQGYESHILTGAEESLPLIQAVYSEVLFGRLYKEQSEFRELDEKLRRHEFWLFRLYNEQYGTDGRLLWADALWLNSRFTPETSGPNPDFPVGHKSYFKATED